MWRSAAILSQDRRVARPCSLMDSRLVGVLKITLATSANGLVGTSDRVPFGSVIVTCFGIFARAPTPTISPGRGPEVADDDDVVEHVDVVDCGDVTADAVVNVVDAVAGITVVVAVKTVVAGEVAVVDVDIVGDVVDTVVEIGSIVSVDGGVVGGEDFLGGTPLPAPTCDDCESAMYSMPHALACSCIARMS